VRYGRSRIVPAAVAAADLATDRGELCKNRSRILDEIVVFELMGKIGDRPPLVGLGNAEQVGNAISEPVDAKTGIEKQRADVGRRHEVLQIAVGAGDRLELELELAVDRLKLFVDRLQLFLAGFELLGGRAILLVDRLQLFVGGAQFLVGRIGFLSHRAQTCLRELQLLGETPHRFVGRLLIEAHERFVDGLTLDEHDDGSARLPRFVLLDRLHQDVDAMRRTVEPYENGKAQRRLALLEDAIERRAQLEADLGPDEIDGIDAERASGGKNKASGVLGEVDDPVAFVDQDAGRGHLLDGAPVRGRFPERDSRAHGP
jgi:hypothetical protein